MVQRTIRRVREKVVKVVKTVCKHERGDTMSYDPVKKATILTCLICGAKKEIPDEPARKRAEEKNKHHATPDHAKRDKKKKH